MAKTIRRPDPTQLEIFKNIFHSIAEEMGAALRRSAFSPNIKERRDYSCAVYEPQAKFWPWAITCPCIWAPCPHLSRLCARR